MFDQRSYPCPDLRSITGGRYSESNGRPDVLLKGKIVVAWIFLPRCGLTYAFRVFKICFWAFISHRHQFLVFNIISYIISISFTPMRWHLHGNMRKHILAALFLSAIKFTYLLKKTILIVDLIKLRILQTSLSLFYVNIFVWNKYLFVNKKATYVCAQCCIQQILVQYTWLGDSMLVYMR